MNYKYNSVVANEISDFLNTLSHIEVTQHITALKLKSYDNFLICKNITEKGVRVEIAIKWVEQFNITKKTKNFYLRILNSFSKYLNLIDINSEYIEINHVPTRYVPYVFSYDEVQRIFEVADSFEGVLITNRSFFMFPVALRILYGCGLRLGETLSLQWENIDLVENILTIKESKKMKERFVPMHESLGCVIRKYHNILKYKNIDSEYLFASYWSNEKPYSSRNFSWWFDKVLKAAGIIKTDNKHRRGKCLHCMRHTFTHYSFLKSEAEGRNFNDAAPYLAAYLGHDGPHQTETYLSSSHIVYMQSHERVNMELGHLFPEVKFNES